MGSMILSQLLKMGHLHQASHTPLQCKGYPQSLRAHRNSTGNTTSQLSSVTASK